VLARHCAGASSVEKAVDYWLKAGQQAIRTMGDEAPTVVPLLAFQDCR
jgi:hypothetical protein